MAAPAIRSPRPDIVSLGVVISHLAFTYLPVALAAASAPGPILLLYWFWFGIAKNGLINLMHEAAHALVFRNVAANEFLGRWVLAPLVITEFGNYRERHWEHHAELGTAKDPKLVYRTDIRGLRLGGLVIRCFLGIEALKRLTEKPPGQQEKVVVKRATLSLPLTLTQAAFFAIIAGIAIATHATWGQRALATGLAYGGVYAYGLSSLTVLAAALRALGEHQDGNDPQCAMRGNAALRNLRCNALTRLFLGAYGFEHHATHHLRPAVPYYHLPELTAALGKDDPTLVARTGYLTVIALLATQAPEASWSAHQRPAAHPAIQGRSGSA